MCLPCCRDNIKEQEAGLTQRELARLGTSASAICRLEHADYEGHSMAMLKRIATVLNKRMGMRFVALQPKAHNEHHRSLETSPKQ